MGRQRRKNAYNHSVWSIVRVATRDGAIAFFCHCFLPTAFRLFLTRYNESSCNHVPVAQLDRASASGAEGFVFESRRGYL